MGGSGEVEGLGDFVGKRQKAFQVPKKRKAFQAPKEQKSVPGSKRAEKAFQNGVSLTGHPE